MSKFQSKRRDRMSILSLALKIEIQPRCPAILGSLKELVERGSEHVTRQFICLLRISDTALLQHVRSKEAPSVGRYALR